jgi:hypothetical protein
LRKLRDSTIALVNALVDQGVLTRAKADAIIAQALQQAGAKAAVPGARPANGAPARAGGQQCRRAAAGATAPARPLPVWCGCPMCPRRSKRRSRDEVKQDVLAQAKTERWGNRARFRIG